MARRSALHHLYQWLFVLGVAVLAAPPLLTVSARSAVVRNRTWASTMNQTLDSLSTIRDTLTDPARIAWMDNALDVTRRGLARAEDHLARSQRLRDSLWMWNGRGPLLVVVGMLFLLMGHRLHRFERYGT